MVGQQPQINYTIFSSDRRELTDRFTREESSIAAGNANTWVLQPKPHSHLRVCAYNVHGFIEARDQPLFTQVIRALQADFLAILEFSVFGELSWFTSLYPYRYIPPDTSNFAFFSNYPITNCQIVNLSSQRKMGDVTILTDSGYLNLLVPHLHYQDQASRVQETQQLLRHYRAKPYQPTVVMGDLNQVNAAELAPKQLKIMKQQYKERNNEDYNNQVFELLSQEFTDSFARLGWRAPPSTHWTTTRVDYVLVNKAVEVKSSYVFHGAFSDHLPIMADLSLG